jgi:hypothetical protein
MTDTDLINQTTSEADNLLNAIEAEAKFDRLLKFKKGEYKIGEDDVPLGTEFIVHPAAWLKAWIKFVDRKVADRKVYRVAKGERPADRNDLDDLHFVGTDNDPWSLQYLLPLENLETGEIVIFTTVTVGGQQCVREVCDAYAKRVKRGQDGQPIVALRVKDMPTKNHGTVPRPWFEIASWDDATEKLATAIPMKAVASKRDDMDDEIPF